MHTFGLGIARPRANRVAVRRVACAAVLAVPLVGCAPTAPPGEFDLIGQGELVVCTDAPYPPIDVIEGDEFAGSDGDFVTVMADSMKLRVIPKDTSYDAPKSALALNSRQCDLVASATTVVAEREDKLDFSGRRADKSTRPGTCGRATSSHARPGERRNHNADGYA